MLTHLVLHIIHRQVASPHCRYGYIQSATPQAKRPYLRGLGILSLWTPGLRLYSFQHVYPCVRCNGACLVVCLFIISILPRLIGAQLPYKVAYLLIIKDTVPTIIGLNEGWERELVLVVTSLLIVVPLSMQRDMASLAFTSLLSVTADVILVLFIAGFAPVKETVSEAGGFGKVLRNDWLNPTIFIGLGILSTAMACQHSAFIVSGSLANKTRARWAAVTYRSITTATILCLIMGIFGYLGFLDNTMGDILNNFDEGSPAANGARGLLAITMFFTYPMESFVARHVLVKLIHNGDMDGEAAAEAEESSSSPGFLCMGRRQTWTLAIYIVCLIPALIVDDIGPVLSITGSLGGSCISYIAPGLIYLGVHGDEFMQMVRSNLENRRQRGSHDGATGDIELPVAGDSNTVMQAPSVTASHKEMSKPLWW